MKSGGASRTAVFVCQGRAVADGRLAPEYFADPIARLMLTEAELDLVDLLRAGRTPDSAGDRFAAVALTACSELMVPRTVLIDQAIAEAVDRNPHLQVVVLGAGLDGRPWRMQVLSGLRVFTVDHPASQADMLVRTAALAPPLCDLRCIPVDLSAASLGQALVAGGHDSARPTLWLWEGVIPYLDTSEVLATISALSRLSIPGSRLIAQYQVASWAATIGRRLAIVLAGSARQQSVLADEPWKSTWSPPELGQAVAIHGWRITADTGLLEQAASMAAPTGNSRSLSSGRVLVADL